MNEKASFEGNSCQQVFPVFQQYRDELIRFVNNRLQDKVQSEALVSDVLIKMHRQCEQLPQIHNIRAWLFQVTRNTLHDYFREQTRVADKSLNNLEDNPSWAPEEQATLAALIPSMMHCLPRKYARPLQMSDLEGIPQKDIAETLNLSVSGVKSRIQRGRQKLKALFHECLSLELNRQGVPVDFSIRPDCTSLQQAVKNSAKNISPEQTAKNCSC